MLRRSRLRPRGTPLKGLETTCCGKKRYATQAAAEYALERIRGLALRDKLPARVYACDQGWYHLTSQAKPYTGPDRATRDLVLARDGGCVICGAGPYGLQVHHRKARRMGGRTDERINAPSNLVTLCAVDHTWVESRRAEALEMGLLVAEHDDPAQVPALGLLLDDDGGATPVPHADQGGAS